MMASLNDLLPKPTDGHVLSADAPTVSTMLLTTVAPSSQNSAPASSSKRAVSTRVLTLPRKDDQPDYSVIVRQGENAQRIVHTSLEAMTERNLAAPPLPSKQEIEETARKTRAAIDKLLTTTSRKVNTEPSFIRYTPANTNTTIPNANRQRIIKLVETPADPMEPPRHSHRKAPVNPPSPPVPVLHSPDRKLSKKEAAKWKIPPVVSNWKNNRGYTISLDKRLAADGRDLVDHSINDRFAVFAEAMYEAERDARKEVETRSKLQRQATAKAREARQSELRQLAEQARQERKGFLGIDVESTVAPSESAFLSERARPLEDDAPPVLQPAHAATAVEERPVRRRSRDHRFGDSSSEIEEEVRRRNEIRAERKRQRDREFRQRDVRGDGNAVPMLKRSKLTRDQDRDLSERVALGQAVGKNSSSEVMYDQRLFNQDGGASRRGTSLAGGYGPDDSYNLYDKPLFVGANSSAKFQYRGSGATDVDERERRFQADRGFSGTGRKDSEVPQRYEPRDRPVEFEKDTELKSSANNDPYGLDKFLKEARQSRN